MSILRETREGDDTGTVQMMLKFETVNVSKRERRI